MVGYAQNRAPSCWLNYYDNTPGDIIMTDLKIISPSPLYTYYCALQWNAGMVGGGYCGLQEHPNGRNFIYSIWDPVSSNDTIIAAYTAPGTQVQNFGGEGTGLKSWNFDLGWSEDEWLTIVSRNWNNNGNSYFGYWVRKQSNQKWYHLVTMDFPVSNVHFDTRTGSFIEDWYGNGWNERRVHFRQGWKRSLNTGDWIPYNSAYFDRVDPDPGAANYLNNFDGNIENDYFFMQSGGNTYPSIGDEVVLNLKYQNTQPEIDTCIVDSVWLVYNSLTKLLNVEWKVDSTKSPQFSYLVEMFDNPTCSGVPMYSQVDTVPHLRELQIDCSGLNYQRYYVRVKLFDIFDGESDFFYADFYRYPNASFPSDGLLASYPLNEDANDITANQIHGIAFGGIDFSALDRFGNLGGAAFFDGVDDYISLGNSPLLNPSEYSICFWYKTDNSLQNQKIYRWRYYGNSVSIQNGYLFADYLSLSSNYSVSSNTLIADGEWHFGVVTFNGNELTLYLDGQPVDNLVTNDPVFYGNGSASIARDGNYNGEYFEGSIDDFRIYSRDLISIEVISLYQEQEFLLNLKVYLSGPFNEFSELMNPDLNPNDIPLFQPFNASPWNYSGTESITSIPNNRIVDWVLLELHDVINGETANESTIIERKAGFLLSDGSIVYIDGSSLISFSNEVSQNLFIAVYHRNHLPIMSANPLNENNGVYSYDFTTGPDKTYGGSLSLKELSPGVWGMIAADANADGQIDNLDKNDIWRIQNGNSGYLEGDFNMNGTVDNSDKLKWEPNTGKGKQLPE